MTASLSARCALGLYRLTSVSAAPLVRRHLKRRRALGREDPRRIEERFGRASLARPEGPLVWIHGASVGESVSALPLVHGIRASWPGLNLLMTTGTVTSAKLMAERLPAGVIHQYIPVDLQSAVRGFLDHWQPALGVIVESEFWPNLLSTARRRGTDLVLVNGRISPKSFVSWRRFRPAIGFLLGHFSEILAQSPEDLRHFQALGAASARCLGNLKFAAPPLDVDADELARLRDSLGERPRWLAASTHPGEDAMAAAAHRAAAASHERLCTLIVPRHPHRGTEIADALRGQGLSVALRSAGDALAPETTIYIADTIGEMGLWYRLADIVWIGGSLVPHGGQNPLEPAKLDCALLAGPHTTNFLRVCDEMEQAGGLRRVTDETALAAAVTDLLDNESARQALAGAAARYAEAQSGVLDKVLAALSPHLDQALRTQSAFLTG